MPSKIEKYKKRLSGSELSGSHLWAPFRLRRRILVPLVSVGVESCKSSPRSPLPTVVAGRLRNLVSLCFVEIRNQRVEIPTAFFLTLTAGRTN